MSEEEVWRSGAERYADYFGDVRRQLSTEFAADTRWITASLFALNVGGLLKVAEIEKPDFYSIFPIVLFWLGILFAFCFVSYSQNKTRKFLHLTQKIENFWVVTSVTGIPGGEELTRLESERHQIKTGAAKYLSMASFLMFTAGLSFLVWP